MKDTTKELQELGAGKSSDGSRNRLRIKTEEKAKVVAYVWGGRIYSIPGRAIAGLPKMILKNRMNSSFSFKSSW